MNWLTIYDVRNGWGLWIAGTLTIATVVFDLFMLVVWVRVVRMASGPSQRRKQLFGGAALFATFAFVTALPLGVAVSNFLLRADLNSGRFMETEGLIDGAHIELSGRRNTMYFKIGERWFELPYDYSPECFPHDGEPVKVAFESSADVKHAGPPAHTILRMQMTHGCELPIGGEATKRGDELDLAKRYQSLSIEFRGRMPC